jgi:TonB family protein
LQPLQDNNLRNFPSEKKKGLTGALIIHIALLLVMIFVGFTIPPPPQFEEGILVNFGTGETGFGLIEPAPSLEVSVSSSVPASVSVPSSTPARPATTTVRSTDPPLLTQDFEDAPEVRRVDPNAERIRQEAEVERIRVEAERQRQTDIANNIRDALAGSRNAGSTSDSEGITGGAGNQGVPTGSLDSRERGEGGSGTGTSGTGSGSGGSSASYELGGRRNLSLPLPRYNYQAEGRVVVQVSVDREGRVTQATSGFRGSTTLNADLVNAAREAALQTRFEPSSNAPATQVGTITYNFKLN